MVHTIGYYQNKCSHYGISECERKVFHSKNWLWEWKKKNRNNLVLLWIGWGSSEIGTISHLCKREGFSPMEKKMLATDVILNVPVATLKKVKIVEINFNTLHPT